MQDESCYGNYWGSVKFKHEKQNGWKPVCFVRQKLIVVDQLKLNAKNKNTTESTQTWLNVWEKWANERKFNPKLEEYKQEDLDKKLQMFYAEVRTKEGFFYNFVENNFIINKKSYDRSCISWYMVACDINFLRFSNCTGPQLMQFWELWKDHLCHITKHTSIYTLSYTY